MTVRISRRRGQPLFVLAAVMLCWIGVRAVIWHLEHGVAAIVPHAVAGSMPRNSPTLPRNSRLSLPLPGTGAVAAAGSPAWPRPRGVEKVVGLAAALLHPGWSPPQAGPGYASDRELPYRVVAGPMLRAQPLVAVRPSSLPPPLPPPPVPVPARAERRWSADAWALVRSGGGVASAGPSFGTYGASQVGAVLRYRPWPGNPHRLTSYVRGSAALNGSGEREAALGLSVRPIGALPVFVAGEGRVSRLSGLTVVRPAVMAVTELPPIDLPKGARAEFYLQGGYVGGLGATPFIDGQLRIDRRIARVGPIEMRAGGGAWGGAQRGAGRLDLGPAITLQVARGVAAMRLGLDWRFRLMGAAAPASGPALTISAGF